MKNTILKNKSGTKPNNTKTPKAKIRIDDIEKAILKSGNKNTKETQSFNKVWNYVLELLRNEGFQKEISKIRSAHQDTILHRRQLRVGYDGAPVRFTPEAIQLCFKYKLHSFWADFLTEYILTGNITKPKSSIVDEQGLCSIVCFDENGNPIIDVSNPMGHKNFPIAIRISPYATQRDIIDFIKKNYSSHIEPLKKLFADKKSIIGKVKKKNAVLEDIKEYIFNNKNKKRSELIKEIEEKFKVKYLYYQIEDLLKQEKNRRKKTVLT